MGSLNKCFGVMHLVYPKIRLASLTSMLRYAMLGALLAGFYGVLHDQITFSISHEYFTRLKFSQFHYANFGLPPRVFVAEIGFLEGMSFVSGAPWNTQDAVAERAETRSP